MRSVKISIIFFEKFILNALKSDFYCCRDVSTPKNECIPPL